MGASTTKPTLPLTIGGESRFSRSGETLSAVNPATGEEISRFPRGTAEDVDDAVSAAKHALPEWRDSGPLARAAAVRNLADVIEAHAEELALLDVHENGTPIRQMRRAPVGAATLLRYFAGLALELRGATIPGTAGRLDYTLLQPYGVVGRIIPFNHPLMFAAGRIAAPLIAGNTVVRCADWRSSARPSSVRPSFISIAHTRVDV